MSAFRFFYIFGWILVFVPVSALGQIPQIQPGVATQFPESTTAAPSVSSIRPDYVLGPGDQILLSVPQEEQLNERPFRIDQNGNISLPLVGFRAS